jgi:type IV pilus assembly protein PilQ
MKSLRLSFVFLLIFTAVTVSATVADNDCSLCVETGGKMETISESPGETFYELHESKVQIIKKGVPSDSFAKNDIIDGIVNDERVFKLELNSGNHETLWETVKGVKETVRIGKIEDLAALDKPCELKTASVRLENKEGFIKFAFTVQPESVRYFTLKGPDRMVFDFIGIKGKMPSSPDVRSANHPSGFRVVIERETPKYFSLKHDKSFKIEMSGKEVFTAFKVVKDQPVMVAEKSTEEPVTPAVNKNKEDKKGVEITGLAFVGQDPEILMVKADSVFDVKKSVEGDTVQFTISDAFLAEDKEQVIDASSLNGPVSELAIFNDEGSVKIVAKMQSDDHEIEIQGTSKSKEFVFGSKKQKVEAVAGYSEAQIVRIPEAVTGQTDAFQTGPVKMEDPEAQYRGQKINLDFKDVDILDVLRLLADISKLNIIAGDDVKGTVTVRLVDIPWDEALDVILKSKSLGKERFGNIIRVAHMRTLQREQEAELAKKKAEEQLEPIKVRLIAVNYAMANNLIPQIKELLSDRGTVGVDERTNVLIIKDIEENLDKSEQLVEYLDTQTPQVLIEARIVEATSTAARGLGIEWGQSNTYTDGNGHPTGAVFPYNMAMGANVSVPGPADRTGGVGFSFGSVGMINDLNLTLNVMESEGKIKIVSSPKIATLDNTEAMIQQGVSIPITTRGTGGDITTKYVDATLILKATPHITADGSILMSIEINKSEPDWSNANYLGEPSIIKKEAKTEILIKSGDTVVIGGVYTNKTSTTQRGVPILQEIPILGWLFKSRETKVERSELLIFMTPRIMNKVKSNMPMATSANE